MSASIKTFLILLLILPLIFWIGTEVGGGDFAVPIVFAALTLGFALNSLLTTNVRYDAFLLGVLSIGYIVGNRGFAAIGPSASVPLYVGEIGMVACVLYMTLQQIITHDKFIPSFTLSKILAAFLAYGGILLIFQVQTFGVLAVRDSAMVYYAVFFFIAYQSGSHERSRRFFVRSLCVGFFLLIPTGVVTRLAPEVYQYVTLRGVPIILQKGDLVGIFCAVGALFFFSLSYQSRWRKALRASSAASIALMFYVGARAGLLSLLVPAVFLYVARMRRIFVYMVVLIVFGVAGTILYATVTQTQVTETQVFDLYEKFLATLDPKGEFNYQTANAGTVSASNNQFRLVWWETVIADTTKDSPWVGLGFGYNITDHFARLYFGYVNEEVADTRSPHSYPVGAYARMGLIGLIFVLVIAFYIVRGCYHSAMAVRRGQGDYVRLAMWLSAFSIFVGGCFGVVLEGPMGGILFWSCLGMACVYDKIAADEKKNATAMDLLDRLELQDEQPDLLVAGRGGSAGEHRGVRGSGDRQRGAVRRRI